MARRVGSATALCASPPADPPLGRLHAAPVPRCVSIILHRMESRWNSSIALDQTFQHAHGSSAMSARTSTTPPRPARDWTVRDLLSHIDRCRRRPRRRRGRVPRPSSSWGRSGGQFREAAAPARWPRGEHPACSTRSSTPAPARCRTRASPASICSTPRRTPGTSQPPPANPPLPDGVAEAALEASRATISSEIRHGRFGPEVAAATLTRTDRLVAFLGVRPDQRARLT